MQRTPVKALLSATQPSDDVLVQGWVRTRRDSKAFSFIEINDGSCLKGVQVIADATLPDYPEVSRAATGASIEVRGQLVASKGQGQQWEVVARTLKVLGEADATYPLQKKGHSLEFLREIAHLRPRSNLFGAVFRVRSRLAFAIHEFFQSRGFLYVHTPIITGSDCEGAGQMFRVSTLDMCNPPRVKPEGAKAPPADGPIDYTSDFFGKESHLTVSGQLNVETYCTALSRVYTFGPTFRAENSNTSRHLAEFWMVEPEIAFANLHDDSVLAEDFIKFLIKTSLAERADDMKFFDERIEKGLLARLTHVLDTPFVRISYTEAIKILEKAIAGGHKFEYPVKWGTDLQSEHERFLTEQHFKGPVILMNYPKQIKAFYMRCNDPGTDGFGGSAPGDTVAAMDVLVPGVGEIIGGSQREERLDKLDQRINEMGLPIKEYWWYRDLRRYGTVPHAGFGLGFERAMMFITGMQNVRDVIPFPRAPKLAEF